MESCRHGVCEKCVLWGGVGGRSARKAVKFGAAKSSKDRGFANTGI